MAVEILQTDYFYTTVRGGPGEAFRVLSELAVGEVNMQAFNALPLGPNAVQFTVFPTNVEMFVSAAEKIGLVIDGPHPAVLIRGVDRLGALAEIHSSLAEAGVPVFSSSGVTSGPKGFGYVIYVQPSEVDNAMAALRKLD